jgi:hypothetical protein
MPMSSNHTEVSVHWYHGKHTGGGGGASSRTLLSDLVCTRSKFVYWLYEMNSRYTLPILKQIHRFYDKRNIKLRYEKYNAPSCQEGRKANYFCHNNNPVKNESLYIFSVLNCRIFLQCFMTSRTLTDRLEGQ